MIWRWNSADHVGLDETVFPLSAIEIKIADGSAVYDLVHFNAIAFRGPDVLVSLRHASAVYAISRAPGRIDWKLGGTTTAQSLAVEGDPEELDAQATSTTFAS